MPHQRHSSQEESVSQLVGVIRHEFNMSVRRKGLWIAYLIVFGFFCLILVREGLDHMYSGGTPWQEAGETVYLFNMLLPLIGGILAADRMQRDHRLGVRELQTSAPLSHTLYILGKYAGVLLSLLLPMFLWVVGLSIFSVTMGLIGPAIIGAVVVAFAAIAIPSFAFVHCLFAGLPTGYAATDVPNSFYRLLVLGQFPQQRSLPYHQWHLAECERCVCPTGLLQRYTQPVSGAASAYRPGGMAKYSGLGVVYCRSLVHPQSISCLESKTGVKEPGDETIFVAVHLTYLPAGSTLAPGGILGAVCHHFPL